MTIKKAIIKNDSLPAVNSDIDGYLVRYRIVSEDSNRLSHWSPAYFIDPAFTYISKKITIAKSSSHINLIWDPVSINKDNNFIRFAKEYDVWLKWGKSEQGDWLLEERIEGTSLSVNIPDTYFNNGVEVLEKPNQLTVEVYVKTEPAARNSKFLVYSPSLETV